MTIDTFERDYFKFLLSDEIAQFQSGKSNAVLLAAIARQLESVAHALRQLITETSVETAYGIPLDNIGDIVKLTRAQAGLLSNEITTDFASIDKEILQQVSTPSDLLESHAQNGIIPFPVVDDTRYRAYLKYKIFLNNNMCTYPELMKSMRMFWTRSPVLYTEDVTHNGQPLFATICLETPELPPNANARLFFLIPIIKAAGVSIIRKATTVTETAPKTIRAGGAIFSGVMETTLPHVVFDLPQKSEIATVNRTENIMVTLLPKLED